MDYCDSNQAHISKFGFSVLCLIRVMNLCDSNQTHIRKFLASLHTLIQNMLACDLNHTSKFPSFCQNEVSFYIET